MRWLVGVALLVFALLLGPLTMVATGAVDTAVPWHEADRGRSGLAPEAQVHPDAVVQVYAARAFRWRGVLAVHTWIATKEPDADHYRVFEVTGWGRARVIGVAGDPDRNWFGNAPDMLADYRGAEAEALIGAIEDAVARYPHRGEYQVWPGPNSNTFTAWVAREVDGLNVAFPSTAIGKDYLSGAWVAPMPSGTGYQLSMNGVFGVGVAREEGLELNLLGLVLGIEPRRLGVKLPGVGSLGLRSASVE